MTLQPNQLTDVITRLKRAQGQLGGIITMIEEGRDCSDVVIQLAAVGKAVDRAGFALISRNLRECLAHEHAVDTAKLEKLFLTLA